MAGKIIVSTLQSDTDNSISFVANTGATIFSANLSHGIAGSFIADGTITAAKIADGAIVATEIADGAVTGPKLGANAVSSNNIIASATLTTPIISGNLNLDSIGTTGVRVPAANTIAIHTAGTEDIRITSNGWVGVGTTTPANTFSVKGTGIVAERDVDTDRMVLTYNDINVYANASGGTNHNIFTLRQSNNTTSNNRLRVTATGLFQFDSGYGDIATAYGCRAWVNFNGTGTVAIRGSGNVSSITDNGTGDYTINLTTAMPDVNYCTQLTGMRDSDGNGSFNATIRGGTYSTYVTTSSVRILAENDSGTRVDPPYYGAAFFR